MAEKGKVKVGIIGSGFEADIHAESFRIMPEEAEVVAIQLLPALENWLETLTYDRRQAARKLFGSNSKIRFDPQVRSKKSVRTYTS